MRLEDHILVNQPVQELYRLISDLENHANLLPGYIESRIVQRSGDSCVLQREAVIHGTRRRWKSEVICEPNRALHFRQMEGPLEGMQVHWNLNREGTHTRFTIIHDLAVRPRWKKWWLERFVAKPAIEKTARLVLEAVKVAAEKDRS